MMMMAIMMITRGSAVIKTNFPQISLFTKNRFAFIVVKLVILN
jgi:Trp operon repressor